MKKSISQKFENKLITYSLAAGTVLSTNTELNASVEVTIVNAPLTYPPTATYYIDFDQVGGDGNDIIISFRNTNSILVQPNATTENAYFIGKVIGGFFTCKPLSINQGVPTNPGTLGVWGRRGDRAGTVAFPGYAFDGLNDRYLGVRFEINSSTHYGWVKLDIGDDPYTPITVESFAYETTPNTGISAPLPVELISFTALQLDNAVKLLWETATEVNNYGFEIERASTPLSPPDFPSGDEGWEKIGFVQGHGNSSSPKSYEFIDSNLPSGNLQYRLKQIDTGGSYEYYGTIAEISNDITSVQENNLPLKFTLEQNYPNPFNPATKIKFTLSESGTVILSVYNSLGEKIATLLNKHMDSGIYEHEFNAANLPSGFYIYKIDVAGKFAAERKMLVLK